MKEHISFNRKLIKKFNRNFVRDVDMFKDEMIYKIIMWKERMLMDGNDIMIVDLKKMNDLEKDNKSLLEDIARMRDALLLLKDQSYKLFIQSVECREQLSEVHDHLESIKESNIIESFEFERDSCLDRTFRDCKQLGNIHDVELNNTDEAFTTALQKKPEAPTTPSLLDKQLTCTNLKIDEDCLSYVDTESSKLGLYVTKKYMEKFDCFEIKILSMGTKGSLAIGVVGGIWNDDDQDNVLPGFSKYSAGYHSDGTFYNGDKPGRRFGIGPEWKVGDRIQCGVKFSASRMAMFVHFARNGKWIESWRMRGFCLHCAIGMTSADDKVKVTFGGKMAT